MPRRVALLLGLTALSLLPLPPGRARADSRTYVGPTRILLVDQDTVLTVVTREWLSAGVRNQEKLLRSGARMKYWSEHLPADMTMVYDALGYPWGRVLATPVGHTEEWWYYGLGVPPLRFRDGALLDTERFEDMLPR